MGFPSPAANFALGMLNLNDIHGVTSGDSVLVDTSEGYALLSKTRKPVNGDTVMLQFCGSTQFAKLQGASLITSDGEAIEGDALADVVVIGKVVVSIISTRKDDRPII
ncbi:hypothetical protein [Buttiauxella sp. S19-1]|uniref:hypothetical protein n=1 Tax=Buttiauxella sp. S19-1 TaxID=941430 RepID=UPI001EDC09F4|nr:hypothetical protein [Buttiauxella sp. S19-1]